MRTPQDPSPSLQARTSPLDLRLLETLREVARFYDACKLGDAGPLGLWRSTDLSTLLQCLGPLLALGIIAPQKSRFLDLGCGDGRVVVFMSYLMRLSVGVELEEILLEGHTTLRTRLEERLRRLGLPVPPPNIRLFSGDSTRGDLHERIRAAAGAGLEDFDLFYTYLVLHEEFAHLVARKARPGAVLMIYGLGPVLPRYPGLELLTPRGALQGILALYRKG